jgi:hypothetical protein
MSWSTAKHRRRARNSQASAHFVATYMTAAVATCAKSTLNVRNISSLTGQYFYSG